MQTEKQANRRILVIDDNRAIHDDFRKIFGGIGGNNTIADFESALFGDVPSELNHGGYVIDSAYQGREGLELVEKAIAEGDPYQMAFVDMRMPPGWDGIETIAQIWGKYPDLQVVICTAYSDYSWDDMTKVLGISDRLLILKKPFDNIEVLQMAVTLTEKWRLLQETRQHAIELENRVTLRTEELRKSEERFSGAFEHAPIGVVLASPDGRFLKVNRALCDLLGYSEAELLTRTFQDITHSEDVEISRENVRRTISGEIPTFQMEKRYLHKQGQPVTVLLSISLVRDDQGKPRYFIGQIQDISERKAGEKSLRDSEEKFRQLAENISDVFWMTSPDMRQTHYVSPAYEHIWGRSAARLYTHPQEWAEAILPEDRERTFATFGRVMADEPNVNVEFRIVRPDGEVRWILSRGAQIRDCTGKLIRITGISTDITERKMFEVQLHHAQKLESIGQLAAGIAHEINTPTQFIGDNTRFVRDAFRDLEPLFAASGKLLDAARKQTVTPEVIAEVDSAREKADLDYLLEEVPKAISQSIEGIERVTKIVRAMKEFSHPGAESKTLLDLNHAIESTLTVCHNEWKYVADLVTEFDPQLPVVPVLPGEFNQVILNLIINAAHAIADKVGEGGKNKGTITVSTQGSTDAVEVRIQDSGSGIPEKVRQRIFEPFFTTKGVGKGTGQGLAIARSVVVDKHGGTIHFETETGKGTCFIIRLPLKAIAISEKAV